MADLVVARTHNCPFLDGFIYSNSPDQIETSNPTDIWLKRYKLRVYPLGVMGLL